MILSGGELVLADTTPTFARGTYFPNTGIGLVGEFASYGEIYRRQLWVYVVVRKRAIAAARLPLKVYERSDQGRAEQRDSPYAQLLRRPNPVHNPFFFWTWISSTRDIYGEALAAKVRDTRGQVRELWPLHPANVQTRNLDGELVYMYFGGAAGTVPQFAIPARDILHFRSYNPDTTVRGMSPLEPLRQTLVNEDAARRATTSFWTRGARPSVALVSQKTLSDEAAGRLRARWDAIHAGADNMGGTAVLEEGVEPKVLSLSAEDAQYIDTRKLNREEACAAYDVPPPVVHILDRATFCLPGDALVTTGRGPVPIAEVDEADKVWSLVDGELRTKRVTWSGQTGFKPLLTVKTQNRTLRCTNNHPVLVRRRIQTNVTEHPNRRRYRWELAWVEAGQLQVGDIIVTATQLPEHGSDECPTRTVSEGFAEFCGLLLGDGWVNKDAGVTIARAANAAYMNHYRQVMADEFLQRDGAIRLQEQERMTRFSSASVARELTALGLSGTAHTKTVPAWVFGLSSKLRAAFLRGFLDADGSVDKKGRISFSSCNPTLLRQIRELCIGLGVPVTNLTHRVGETVMPNGRRCHVNQWAFNCSDPGANGTIGSHDPRYVDRLAAGVPFGEGALAGYYEYRDRTGRALTPPTGCGYARVVSIEAGSVAVPVYDLTVEDSHNFVAEGVVVHNSNITEQMRSMYRDTMATELGEFEATLDHDLRPDFDDSGNLYAEFLMDEVMRGTLEERSVSIQAAINSAQLTPNEARALDNKPALPGGDRLFINSALIPIDEVSKRTSPDAPAMTPPETSQELADRPAADVPEPGDKSISVQTLRTVMGRLGRVADLDSIDMKALTEGLNGSAEIVLGHLADAAAAGENVEGFKVRLRATTAKEAA